MKTNRARASRTRRGALGRQLAPRRPPRGHRRPRRPRWPRPRRERRRRPRRRRRGAHAMHAVSAAAFGAHGGMGTVTIRRMRTWPSTGFAAPRGTPTGTRRPGSGTCTRYRADRGHGPPGHGHRGPGHPRRGASAHFQIRVGNQPALAPLAPVAPSAGPGGAVRLTLASPAQGRYVLVWLTKLPPEPIKPRSTV
jgi:hypothetical protein